MKKYSIKDIKQKMIASLATVIIIFNFILPPRADAIVSEASDVLQSLICWIGDAVINGLQTYFIGNKAVYNTLDEYMAENTQRTLDETKSWLWLIFGGPAGQAALSIGAFVNWIKGMGDYNGPVVLIQYSIANIVSNQIPAFDVNFFKAGIKDTEGEQNGKKSTATELKSVVQKWYYAFRNLALIALLSILLYLGIKIVLSSAAGEKARHKENIKNWLMAVVLLFSLHYIMAFTLNVIDELNTVLRKNITVKDVARDKDGNIEKNPDGTEKYSEYDSLMGTIRIAAETSEEYTDNMVYTIMYSVLIVYTIMFTLTYFKRTIYIVFLTMIAPLVAVTYPLDKEKDGKSQAFDMWMKEYFFNSLLQPIHLILYYVLVSSAQDLVNENWIYALVAIGFMLPAENLIRQMFGMEKAGNSSALGGFATGALASQAVGQLKKLKSAGGKSSGSKTSDKNSSDGSEKTNIRMSKMDDVFNSNGGSSAGESSTSGNAANSSSVNKNSAGGNRSESGTNKNNNEGSTNNVKTNAENSRIKKFRESVDNKIQNTPVLRGGAAVAGKVFTRKNVKKGIKTIASGFVKGSGMAVGATAGLALGIANGDVSKAIQYAGTGAAAGLGASNLTIRGVKTLGNGAINLANNTKETYQKGYYDSDAEYQKNVLIPKLKAQNEKDKELQKKYKKAGIDMANSTGRAALYNRGYVNEQEILQALKIQQENGMSDDELVQDAIASKQISKFSDVDTIKKELAERLKNNGLSEEKTNQEVDRRMKDIKKMAGLT